MDWCRVVGPRGLRRPLDEKQVSNKRALSGLLDVLTQGRAGQSRAGQGRPARGQGRAGQGHAQGRAGQGRAGQRRAGQGRAGQRRGGRAGQAGQGRAAAQQGAAGQLGSWAAGRHYSPRIPGGFTLPHRSHRSDGPLGRGPRSQPRAPMQMVSGGLGFRVLKHDIPKNTPNTTQNFQPNPRKPHFRDEIKSFGDMRLCPSLCLGFRMA